MSRSKKSDNIKARDVLECLWDRFGKDPRKYICASEVGITTGGGHRRIDFCVMTCYASEDFAVEGIEIKVDPSDLKHEIQEHRKHEVFFSMFDYYSIAVTQTAYEACKDIIPKDWGIYIAKRNQNSDGMEGKVELSCRRKPMPLEGRSDSMAKGFTASFARKCVNDAVRPYREKDSDSYNRGFKEGYNRGQKDQHYEQDAELSQLQIYKRIFEKLDEDGYASAYGAARAIQIFSALQISGVDQIYNALMRIHDQTASAIAALSGKFGLGEWAEDGEMSLTVTDEEIEKLLEEHDKLMDRKVVNDIIDDLL